jgi:hypothetical protein
MTQIEGNRELGGACLKKRGKITRDSIKSLVRWNGNKGIGGLCGICRPKCFKTDERPRPFPFQANNTARLAFHIFLT